MKEKNYKNLELKFQNKFETSKISEVSNLYLRFAGGFFAKKRRFVIFMPWNKK